MQHPVNDSLLETSVDELRDDLTELYYLYTSAVKSGKNLARLLAFHASDILPLTKQSLLRKIDQFTNLLTEELNEITATLKLSEKDYSFQMYKKLLSDKRDYYDLFRSHILFLGSLFTATDYQSPTFLHSMHSQAGIQTGKIIGTVNDYKRDRHLDETAYEQQFIRTYLDGQVKFFVKAYLTNNGMAAFTTILNFLLLEKKIKQRIVIGKHIYFENKDLVKKTWGEEVTECDENDTESILKTISGIKPNVVIFDSLCNTKSIPVPNLEKIIKYLVKTVKNDIYLVIDNTCLTVFFQILPLVEGKNSKLHLLVLESLNKYHQFGMDRVTAGIIWGHGTDTGKLALYRTHLGTNINDATVYILPYPDRKMLENRMMRLNRNALYLATRLQKFISLHPEGIFEKIGYPGLSNHQSYSWMRLKPFRGSFFTIDFKPHYSKIRIYQRFINLVISEAKKRQIQLVSGTSFGLNTSRIYLTSLRTEEADPFIRFSAGTETSAETEIICHVMISAIKKLNSGKLLWL